MLGNLFRSSIRSNRASLLSPVALTRQCSVRALHAYLQAGVTSATVPIKSAPEAYVTVVKSADRSLTHTVGTCMSALAYEMQTHGAPSQPRVYIAFASSVEVMDLLWSSLSSGTPKYAIGTTVSGWNAFPMEEHEAKRACAVIALTLPAGTKVSNFRQSAPSLPPIEHMEAAFKSNPPFLCITPPAAFDSSAFILRVQNMFPKSPILALEGAA
eukprot:CAMPEP_0198218322 /NCGR_PEP_ID=MMETSP1445-20131203/68603_1 /TAXON_ID=36898 /ORGANISM="Pyramimonas sp., Strain CCMP2087" /LENGTH=212 /DNA_ID=CAMNT_0043895309 /DNA_START=63 /DNA_END=697 /DNA_ORIENTATION=-